MIARRRSANSRFPGLDAYQGAEIEIFSHCGTDEEYGVTAQHVLDKEGKHGVAGQETKQNSAQQGKS